MSSDKRPGWSENGQSRWLSVGLMASMIAIGFSQNALGQPGRGEGRREKSFESNRSRENQTQHVTENPAADRHYSNVPDRRNQYESADSPLRGVTKYEPVGQYDSATSELRGFDRGQYDSANSPLQGFENDTNHREMQELVERLRRGQAEEDARKQAAEQNERERLAAGPTSRTTRQVVNTRDNGRRQQMTGQRAELIVGNYNRRRDRGENIARPPHEVFALAQNHAQFRSEQQRAAQNRAMQQNLGNGQYPQQSQTPRKKRRGLFRRMFSRG